MRSRLAESIDRLSVAMGGAAAATCLFVATLSLTGVAYGILEHQIDANEERAFGEVAKRFRRKVTYQFTVIEDALRVARSHFRASSAFASPTELRSELLAYVESLQWTARGRGAFDVGVLVQKIRTSETPLFDAIVSTVEPSGFPAPSRATIDERQDGPLAEALRTAAAEAQARNTTVMVGPFPRRGARPQEKADVEDRGVLWFVSPLPNRRGTTQGFLTLGIPIETLLAQALSDGTEHVAFSVRESGSGGSQARVLMERGPEKASAKHALTLTESTPAFQREWVLEMWPMDTYVSADWTTSRFVVLGFGLSTSVLLAAFVALLGRARIRADDAREQAEAARLVAAEAVESERDLLRQVVSRAPIHMAMFDTEMRYVAVSDLWIQNSPQGRKVAGREGHIGRCHYDIAPDDREVWGHLHARGLAGETLSSPEDRYVHPDGTTTWLKWTIQPWYHRDGDIGGIFIVSELIDELVSAREKALESARAKSNFLATMSHEIRTPLSGILGMIDLLAETPLQAEQRRYLGYARQSAGTLLTLVGDVLDFSKIDSGRIELMNDAFDVRALVAEVAASFGVLAAQKGVLLTATVADDVPTRMQGDAGKLRQVLVNLVGNAVKFTPQGDVIVVAKRVRQGTASLRIEVSDTGVGIAPGALPRLFQPFTQEDGSTSRRFGGTGLGLAISKRLVELMGGQVGVASVQGFGTTFWIELPMPGDDAGHPLPESISSLMGPSNVHPSFEANVHEDAPWHSGARILVAEDNEVNAFLMRRLLELLGLAHVVVEDGAEALRVLETQEFDLLLLDCQMPVLDGYETARRVRAMEAHFPHRRRMPIVAVTAHALSGEREKCEGAGMDDYLAKPLTPETLRTALTRWLPSRHLPASLRQNVREEKATA